VLVDSHCHLADPAFANDVDETVERAVRVGVGHIVVIGESREASERARELAGVNPRLSATAGVHPHVASTWSARTEDWMVRELGAPEIVAAGEMGLDYHYDNSPRDRQQVAFDAQLAIAGRAGKPAVVHAREADDDVAAILRNHPGTTAILHSWSSGDTLLQTGLALNHYFSFSGMVTFRSWNGQDALRRIPPERLLVETDAPYLAPVPHRGQRNEPAFVALVAGRLADLLGIAREEVERVTFQNAVRVFGERIGRS
jgi:TatD DNase family protein